MSHQPFTPQELAEANRLFERPWRFVKGVVDPAELPPPERCEVAFAGRSNVGKSSLINAIVRQKGLARTSNTPGRTQELNYFEPDDGRLYLVDLPGYGFAKAPKDKVDTWTGLVTDYLCGRPNLARAFLLIDARHGLKPIDRTVMRLLSEAAVAYQVVLTKADKLNIEDRPGVLVATERDIAKSAAAFPHALLTSAQEGTGIDDVRATLARIANEHTVSPR